MGWHHSGIDNSFLDDDSGKPTVGDVEDVEESNKEICTPINIINTNATSLCNKIDSLIDCFEELDVTL